MKARRWPKLEQCAKSNYSFRSTLMHNQVHTIQASGELANIESMNGKKLSELQFWSTFSCVYLFAVAGACAPSLLGPLQCAKPNGAAWANFHGFPKRNETTLLFAPSLVYLLNQKYEKSKILSGGRSRTGVLLLRHKDKESAVCRLCPPK